MLDVMAGPSGEAENLMLPVDHQVSGGTFLEHMADALVDTIAGDVGRFRSAGARVRQRRAKYAARE